MALTTVVNMKTDDFDVYIGRPGKGQTGPFGNPFRAEQFGGGTAGRKTAVAKFANYFQLRMRTDKEYAAEVALLKGRRLGCFCAPLLCHGTVISHYLNYGEFIDERSWANALEVLPTGLVVGAGGAL